MSHEEYITFGEAARRATRAFGLMLKPVGSACNLDCAYCYYLDKADMHGGRQSSMSLELLEECTRQYISGSDADTLAFAWHGGEPLLAGRERFLRALEFQRKYADGRPITNSLQTNGLLLDDEWCRLLRDNGFLVGISIDGPRDIHDAFRADRQGRGTFDRVMAAIELLQRHGVEYNTLTTVNARSAGRGGEVYDFLRGISRYMQFLPVAEHVVRPSDGGRPRIAPPDAEGAATAPWSIGARDYGDFLCDVFDRWVVSDVGERFVQLFDATLAAYMNVPAGLCTMCETCGGTLAAEHNGDVYSCDHFVYPQYRLGNIRERSLRDMYGSEEHFRFGLAKRNTLPRECLRCKYLALCRGGCPQHRFAASKSGERNLDALCGGHKIFFAHTAPYMERMRHLLTRKMPPAAIMPWARRHME